MLGRLRRLVRLDGVTRVASGTLDKAIHVKGSNKKRSHEATMLLVSSDASFKFVMNLRKTAGVSSKTAITRTQSSTFGVSLSRT
jgi:hypothetical protein